MGQIALQTGEIAEDLTYYFATSEQVPSAVGLGVLVNPTGRSDRREIYHPADAVYTGRRGGSSREEDHGDCLRHGDAGRWEDTGGVLELILGEFGLEINDTVDAAFQCDCSKERVSRAIATLSRKDLDDIVSDGESIEVKCQFCNKAYHFDIDELKEMRK